MPDAFEILCSLQVITQITEIGQSNKKKNHGSESHQRYKYFLILLLVPLLLFT